MERVSHLMLKLNPILPESSRVCRYQITFRVGEGDWCVKDLGYLNQATALLCYEHKKYRLKVNNVVPCECMLERITIMEHHQSCEGIDSS